MNKVTIKTKNINSYKNLIKLVHSNELSISNLPKKVIDSLSKKNLIKVDYDKKKIKKNKSFNVYFYK